MEEEEETKKTKEIWKCHRKINILYADLNTYVICEFVFLYMYFK